METGEQHTMSMSSPDLSSSIQSSLDVFSREESDVYMGNGDLHREEDDDVAVARPPRRAAASAEVVLSGQAALDVLDQVMATAHERRGLYPSICLFIPSSASKKWPGRQREGL